MLEELLSFRVLDVSSDAFEDRVQNYPLFLGGGRHLVVLQRQMISHSLLLQSNGYLKLTLVLAHVRKNWPAFLVEYVKYVRRCLRFAVERPIGAISFWQLGSGDATGLCLSCASSRSCDALCVPQRATLERLWLSWLERVFVSWCAPCIEALVGTSQRAGMDRLLIPRQFWAAPTYLPPAPMRISEEAEVEGDRWLLSV